MKWNSLTKKEKEETARMHVAKNYGGCFPDTQSEEIAISCFMDAMELTIKALPQTDEAIVAEAEARYQYADKNIMLSSATYNSIMDCQREAYITCARKYHAQCKEMGELLMIKDGELEAKEARIKGLEAEMEILKAQIERDYKGYKFGK